MNYLKDKNITGRRFSQSLNIYFSLNIGLFNFALFVLSLTMYFSQKTVCSIPWISVMNYRWRIMANYLIIIYIFIFEPTTRYFNQPSNQAISSIGTHSQLSTATPVSFECSDYILAIALVSCYIYFNWNFAEVITWA